MNLSCRSGRNTTAWIGIGAGIGAAFGAATHAMDMSLSLGVAIGLLVDGLSTTRTTSADAACCTRDDGDGQ